MRTTSIALLLSFVAAGCSAESDPSLIDDPAAGGKGDEVLEPLVITAADDGMAFAVNSGQTIVLELPSNPSAGYTWSITDADDAFAYPQTSYQPSGGGLLGSGGTSRFTWTTGDPASAGNHFVALAYHRVTGDASEPEQTFSFSVEVFGAPAVAGPLRVGPEIDGQTFEITAGRDLILDIPTSSGTGYAWVVTSTDAIFGQPKTNLFIPGEGGLGAAGITRLRWSTDLPAKIGSHTVGLHYYRPWESPAMAADSLTFTVVVVEE